MKRLSISLLSAAALITAACQQETTTATSQTATTSSAAPAAAPGVSTQSSPISTATTAPLAPTMAPSTTTAATASAAPSTTPSAVATPPAAPASAGHDHHKHGAPASTSAVKLTSSHPSGILDASNFTDPAVRDAYAKAREIPDRLEKMYCYCHCKENPGLKHKSLLTCFQSDHAAECGICMQEAVMAYNDMKDDIPVEGTQKAADLMYNNGNPPAGHVH